MYAVDQNDTWKVKVYIYLIMSHEKDLSSLVWLS